MSTNLDDFLQEQLKDPEFRAEYEALQSCHAIIQAIIDAKYRLGISEKELAEKAQLSARTITKLENGNANPSIRTLQRLAAGMGMKLKIEFVPQS